MKSKWVGVFDASLIIVQFFISIFFIYLMMSLLPIKYLGLLAGILLILWMIIWIILSKNQNKGKMLTRVVSLVLSIALVFGSLVSMQGLDTIKKIAGLDTETSDYSVIVLNEASYQQLADLAGTNLGYVSKLDADNTYTALSNVKGKVSVNVVDYDNVNTLQSALFNGDVQAILINEAYRPFIDEINSDFETGTRVIYEYQIVNDNDLDAKSVKVTKTAFNVYISGIDTYGEVSSVSRSDVNMIVTVNPNTKTILMTSIPRDYYVTLASFNQKDKLTHAGLYGISESVKTLENLFGIDINYYARVNFSSVETIVNALGGITVENDEAFTSYTKHIYFPAGSIDMDGEKALEFVRERYSLSGGDRSRIKNQQKALAAMLNKAMSPSIITNYSDLLNAISGTFQTNMKSSDITSLIKMQLNDSASWTIEQIQVDGTGSTSTTCYSMSGTALYVMEPDMDTVNAASAKINEVLNG